MTLTEFHSLVCDPTFNRTAACTILGISPDKLYRFINHPRDCSTTFVNELASLMGMKLDEPTLSLDPNLKATPNIVRPRKPYELSQEVLNQRYYRFRKRAVNRFSRVYPLFDAIDTFARELLDPPRPSSTKQLSELLDKFSKELPPMEHLHPTANTYRMARAMLDRGLTYDEQNQFRELLDALPVQLPRNKVAERLKAMGGSFLPPERYIPPPQPAAPTSTPTPRITTSLVAQLDEDLKGLLNPGDIGDTN